MKTPKLFLALAGALTLGIASTIASAAPSGAIFTTVADGSEVNFNHYPSKQAVYLDGGPGPGAPQHAAALPDGDYYFQVTDPSGKTLLSTDPVANRRFTVSGGIIVATTGTHLTGNDIDHPPAKTIQLFPYNDTPNNGGVYKVWATPVADLVGDPTKVNPGYKAGSNVHGFVPSKSKTDNFKVKDTPIVEIDTRFHDANTGEIIDGGTITWTDTVGGTNQKHSYWAPELNVYHEAHVECVEAGTHKIDVQDTANYLVDWIQKPDGSTIEGPGIVSVNIKSLNKPLTVWIDAYIVQTP